MNKINIKNSNFYNWLTNENNCAIILPSNKLENKMLKLKTKVKKLGLGYIELLAEWEENGHPNNARFLLINNLSESQTKNLIIELQIFTCIFKDKTGFKRINVDEYTEESILEMNFPKTIDANFFNKLIYAINETKINIKTFKLYEVEQPRPSYFHDAEKLKKI